MSLGALGSTVGPFMYLEIQDIQKPQTPDQANKHKRTDLRLFWKSCLASFSLAITVCYPHSDNSEKEESRAMTRTKGNFWLLRIQD